MLELLAALADKSILIAEHGEQGVARYRLPETLREFGQERLQQSGEYTALRRRHRDWHEQLARRADTGWLSPQIADLDGPAVPGARQRAGGPGLLPGRAGRGRGRAAHRAARLALLLLGRGSFSEGRYRLGQALARAGEPTVWRAQGLLLAGFLAAISGDRGAAQALLAQGTGLARQLNDPATLAFASYCAGMARLFAGDLPQAISHYEDGLAALPAAAVQDRQRALLLVCLASAAGLAGDEERVVACDRELAALTEAGGEFIRHWYSACSQWALGLVAWHRGDLDRATDLQQQSLRLREGLNDRLGATYCLETLAWIAASGRQYERAAVLLGAATGLRRSMGTDPGRPPAPGGPPRGTARARPGRPWARRRSRPPATAACSCPPPTPSAYALQQSPSPAAGEAASVAVGRIRTAGPAADATRDCRWPG